MEHNCNEVCLSMNIQGLTSHIYEFRQFLQIEDPLVVCINETHITEAIGEIELNVNGYKHFVGYSLSRHAGGVIIYVKNHVNAKLLCNESSGNSYWSLF